MSFGFPNDDHGIVGKPTASEASQIKYLIRVVQMKQKEINSLKLDIKTLGLERQMDADKVARQLRTLAELRDDLKKKGGFTPRVQVPWYRRLFRR